MRSVVLLAGVLLAGLLACGDAAPPAQQQPAASAPEPPAAPKPAAKPAAAAGAAATAEAQEIFATRCVTCHGPQGAGDGPGSAGLDPKPRNFQDPSWQTSVTDEHLEKIVMYGGAAVGKSPTMPGNPDLMAKPEVVKALVAHVRGLAK
jgi:mono/diheme cytochrome c family protein